MTMEPPANIGVESKPASRLDLRTERDIRDQLNAYRPVISERNVWAFWDQGFHAMPPWRQRNVINWIRRLGKDWAVRVLDTVPGSVNHIDRFLELWSLPQAVHEDRMKGHHAGQHTSDFVRLATVYHYGGVYIDVGMILCRDLDDMFWSKLEDPRTPYQVAGMMLPEKGVITSSLMAARRENPFIYRWLKVFLEMWKGREDASGIHQHELVAHLDVFQPTKLGLSMDKDFAKFTDYAAKTQAFLRVRHNIEPGVGGFNGPEYVRNHFLLLAFSNEVHGFWKWPGTNMTKVLMLHRQGNKEINEEQVSDQKIAHDLVYGLLAGAFVCKFNQGMAKLGIPCEEAEYWNQPANDNADCLPGTWGELLRYGSAHYKQTRTLEYVASPEVHRITRAAMLEAVKP